VVRIAYLRNVLGTIQQYHIKVRNVPHLIKLSGDNM